jgi:hypothetical protein
VTKSTGAAKVFACSAETFQFLVFLQVSCERELCLGMISGDKDVFTTL